MRLATPLIKVCFFLLALLIAAPLMAAEPKNLSSVQLQAVLARDKNIFLLDVRTPEEYGQAHLRGARLIPLAELGKRLREVPRDRPLLVYCAVGARSATAAKKLAGQGDRDIYQMSDGLVGWYKNGFPVEK